jgi:serine/threonine protein kinase
MIAERYELVREIGRGGMGAVWLATDSVLGREVAIKRIGVMPGAEDADLVRAEREARLAARLNHPHVIAIYDLVESEDDQGGEHWLVMEYVEGVPLSGLVRRDGALSTEHAAAILSQVADALAAAHAAGIVHRDVTPSNILVTPEGHAKLGDFGIARAEADATLTQTGLVTGSPAYLAPEVASGAVATSASDVWSLGATLFHALEGRPPYETGDNLMGALYRIVNEEPPRPRNAGWLAPLLESTMTRDPEQRWDMARVQAFLAGRDVGAPDLEPLHPQPTTPQEAVVAADEHHTRALAPAPVVDPIVDPVVGAEPREPAEIAAEPSRRGLPWVVPILLASALVVVLVLGALLWGYLQPGDGERRSREPGGSGGGGGASSSTSSSSSTATQPTRQGMRSFIENYLATAPKDPATTFTQLTPEFQDASGGLEGYTGFWKTIESATLTSFTADPQALTVDYAVDYVRTDQTTASGQVHLQLTFADGTYKIASEG